MQGFPINEFPCSNVESVLVVPVLPNSVILHDILDPFPEVPCDESVVNPYSEALKGKNKMNVSCFIFNDRIVKCLSNIVCLDI